MSIIEYNLKGLFRDLLQGYMGRAPSAQERTVIDQLAYRATEEYTPSREHLLVDLHRASGVEGPYRRVGSEWGYLGFQRDDPVPDIRGGGVLALEAMGYFLKCYPRFAQGMIYARSGENITADFKLESFPWAAAGMNLSRMLTSIFEIVDFRGQAKRDDFSVKTYWSLLLTKQAFEKLFVLSFMLLDCIWDELKATYMEFPIVISAVKEELLDMLFFANSMSALEAWVHHRVGYTSIEELDYLMLPDAIENSKLLTEGGDVFLESARHSPSCEVPDFLSSDFRLSHSETGSLYENSSSKSSLFNNVYEAEKSSCWDIPCHHFYREAEDEVPPLSSSSLLRRRRGFGGERGRANLKHNMVH